MTSCTRAVAIAVVLLWGATGTAEEKKYTLADLEALAKSESYKELVEHLEDLRPAERTKKWEQLAERGAIGWIKSLKADRDPLSGLVVADGLLKRYGVLKKSKAFMALRAEVGLKGFEKCFDVSYGGAGCSERLLPFVEADEGNVALASQAAQLMMRKQNHYFAAPYYQLAVKWGKASAKVCKTERLSECVVAALGLPESQKELLAAGLDVAERCFAQLKDTLLENVGKGGYFKDNACPLLKKKKAKASLCGSK